MNIEISSADMMIVLLYLAGLMVFGLLQSRRSTSPEGFFLAAQKARWPVIGLTLFADTVTPTALIGITGAAYGLGISVFNYEWVATLMLVMFAIAFLPAILRSRVFTMPEFLEKRYDRRVRLWRAGLGLLLGIFVNAAGLYGAALVMCQLLPALSVLAAAAILATLASVHAISGGWKAVLYMQSVQAIIILGSALALAIIIFDRAGGLVHVLHTVDPSKLSLIRPALDATMPWTGLLLGAPILSFYFCANQSIVQAMLAAPTMRDAQLGAMFAGLLKLLILFLIVLPGVAATLIFPGLARSDDAYPLLMFNLLPTGLLGLALAAFAGALLVQLSNAYIVFSTIITMDVVRVVKPGMNDRALVISGRVVTAAIAALSALLAPTIARFGSLWQYIQASFAYLAPPVVALLLVGIVWRGATARGAIAAIVAGNGLGAVMLVLARNSLLSIHFLHVAIVLFAVSVIALIIGSKLDPQGSAIAAPNQSGQEQVWFTWRAPGQDVMGFAAALVAATVAIVWWLR